MSYRFFIVDDRIAGVRWLSKILLVWVMFLLAGCGGGDGGDAGAGTGNNAQNPQNNTLTETDVLNDILDCAGIGVKVRAQDMTAEQMQQSCDKLVIQTSEFHTLLQTDAGAPVADDYNDMLEVVIFDDWDNYDEYGQQFFQIDTDNGGIYIEGDPSHTGNQARFYAHEADWLRPDFVVWNLEHEYTHYLDGRYIKYGGFGFYKLKIVWWVEGLAEYVSKKNNSDRANRLLTTTSESTWLTLDTIFLTNYDDGLDRVYGWTYWAHRFMFEEHLSEMVQLSGYLKPGNSFSSYSAMLNQWAIDYQAAFKAWLLARRDELNSSP